MPARAVEFEGWTPPDTKDVRVTSGLKEIAGRISKLSFEDMVSLSRMISKELQAEDVYGVAEALVRVAALIEAEPAADVIKAKKSSEDADRRYR